MIIKPQSKIKDNENGLYIVSTPIGNLRDITLRAIEILKQSDFILCEDTRISKNLLNKYKIQSKLISNHKFNEKKNTLKIIEYLKLGKIISLISDAGTPGISDPGALLVKYCIENQISVQILPGVSAITAFISGTGKQINEFYFGGFMSRKINDIRNKVIECIDRSTIGIWFESPKRILKTVELIQDLYPNLEIVCAKELTKPYETYFRGISVDVYQNLKHFDLRGEWIFLIDGSSIAIDESDKLKQYSIQFEKIGLTGKQVKAVAEMFGLPKNKLYQEFKAL